MSKWKLEIYVSYVDAYVFYIILIHGNAWRKKKQEASGAEWADNNERMALERGGTGSGDKRTKWMGILSQLWTFIRQISYGMMLCVRTVYTDSILCVCQKFCILWAECLLIILNRLRNGVNEWNVWAKQWLGGGGGGPLQRRNSSLGSSPLGYNVLWMLNLLQRSCDLVLQDAKSKIEMQTNYIISRTGWFYAQQKNIYICLSSISLSLWHCVHWCNFIPLQHDNLYEIKKKQP